VSAVCALLFLPPIGSLGMRGNLYDFTGFAIFIAVNVFIAALNEALHRARRRAEGARDALRESEERLRGVVTSATDAIITIDARQRITVFNAGAEAIFGYGASELIGQTLDRLIPERFRVVHGRHVDAFGVTGVSMRAMGGERVLTGLRRTGDEFPLEARISQVEIGGQKLYTVILRDITERKRAEADRDHLLALAERARTEAEVAMRAEHDARSQAEAAARAERESRQAAEAASRAKDAFLATVSHELRTPLSPILTWTRMLRQGGLGPDQAARAIEVIERCARSQAQLVEDLLDVSRIVAGKMRLEVRPVMVAPLIEKAVDIVRPAADAKNVRLQVVLDTEVGAILGDAERLQQVVWNLLSNAVKFTPRDGRVHVVLERVNSHIEIAVSDTGQGIAPAFLPYVFERFQQAEVGASRTHGGLGLGLAIVRHIVEAHGGTVHAESPGAGRGAVFTVKLPLMMARMAGEVQRRHPTVSLAANDGDLPRLEGLRILIVDDEPDSNEVVGYLLGSCGAEIRAAGSAEQARGVLQGWRPDVLVSDIGMPGEDGYGFISSLRANEGDVAQIPAVALTAFASREDKVRLLSAGFQAHVPKPLDPAELVAVIASIGRAAGKL
jgi:PAS domain S-box-containing protein